MKKFILLLFLLVLVAGGVYLAVFERERILDLVRPANYEPEGFTPARTPEGSLAKFREATKARDFETASTYLGGEYAAEMKRAAPSARALGLAIDDLEHNTKPDLMSDPVRMVLRLLEPFPNYFVWEEVKKDGEERARTTLSEPVSLPPDVRPTHGKWILDPLMSRNLVRGWSNDGKKEVELRREGEGREAAWKIYITMNPELPKAVDYFIKKHEGYVKALESVKKQADANKFSKPVDLELALKRAVEAVK